MADSIVSIQSLKSLWNSQVNDEKNWDLNMKLLRATGLFVGAIIFMRDYGDLMAI